MRPSNAMRSCRRVIRRIVEDNFARNPRVFGSVLRGDDTEGSDLDILVDAAPGLSLLKLARLENLLEEQLGVRVEVLTPEDLPMSFRGQVLAEAQAI